MCLTIRKNVLRIADKNNSEAHIQDELKIRNLWKNTIFFWEIVLLKLIILNNINKTLFLIQQKCPFMPFMLKTGIVRYISKVIIDKHIGENLGINNARK